MSKAKNMPTILTDSTGQDRYDVAVIGGGPAGLAAATAACKNGARTLLVEREARLGGILKQCIHDGFGLVRFGEKLSGPEYAHRFVTQIHETNAEIRTLCFASRITKRQGGFELTLVSREGLSKVFATSLVLATGCRERTARQVAIHGTRPAGVLTAGTAQHYVNLLGRMPTKRCVILGSGDIGLIMARRLTLEGAEVVGVYEAKSTCSGLSRNLVQCLHDFDIPLHLSHTVTRVFGHSRLEAVEVAEVDEGMRPIAGTEQKIECDALILSVGLIPENELAESLNVPLHPSTKGAECDQYGMTLLEGVFSCGNALHVNDLVDYVSENGEVTGTAAARHALSSQSVPRTMAAVQPGPGFLYISPQWINLSGTEEEAILYFRANAERGQVIVRAHCDGVQLFEHKYRQLRPPEMERLQLPLGSIPTSAASTIRFTMEDAP